MGFYMYVGGNCICECGLGRAMYFWGDRVELWVGVVGGGVGVQ